MQKQYISKSHEQMDVLFQQLKELQDEVHEIKVKPIYQSQRAKKQLPPTIKRR